MSVNPLTHDGDNDYTLNPGETSVWITVDGISVYVRRTPDEAVEVKLYAKGHELGNELAEASVFQSDAENYSDFSSLTDTDLEKLWEDFGNTPIDEEENIEEDFLHFKAGTPRFEVWHWFDALHSKGVAFLTGAAS